MPQSPTNTAPLRWSLKIFSGDLTALDTEGSWEIGPVFMTSCPIRFGLATPEGQDRASLEAAYKLAAEYSPERHRLANQLGYPAQCQGTARTQDDAIIAIETLRSGNPNLEVADVLASSNFQPTKLPVYFADKSARIYTRKSPTGKFTIEMVGDLIRLEHNRRGNSTTLIRLMRNGPTLNAEKTHFWPARVEMNFSMLAVQAAIKVADEFIRSGQVYPKPRARAATAA
jgi:hypothetical protein